MNQPRYAIGIDLGTTNCVLAYVDLQQPQQGPQPLPVSQWQAPHTLGSAQGLPSFAYLPPASQQQAFPDAEAPASPLYPGWLVGQYAREQLGEQPQRVIHSAKSWLCHAGIDRSAGLLPWQSQQLEAQQKLSPVAASALYLAWLQQLWDRQGPGAEDSAHRFQHQHITITVPASFDEAAQKLTLEAARAAGYPSQVQLLEEPQAAFYCWLGYEAHLKQLAQLLESSGGKQARVLIVDIGGGTTDLSLFAARPDAGHPSGLQLERLAVSDHLLLGGDNIDITLAYELERRLRDSQQKLSSSQWSQLLVQARQLKERLLADADTDDTTQFNVALTSSGSRLFAHSRSTSISAGDIRRIVLEGFFPFCGADARPQTRRSALQEWGLPYAADSGIGRHLAAFLQQQPIDAVLFNGGTISPPALQQRLQQLLQQWQPQHPLTVLYNEALSLAVARGAARYGQLAQDQSSGLHIGGGHAHSLYLEVSAGKKQRPSLVCILPQGAQANQSYPLEETFALRVNQAVRFQCYAANRRPQDRLGDVIPATEKQQLHALPALETNLQLPPERPKPANNRLQTQLEVKLNELGLLQMVLVSADGNQRWQLDFNLRKGMVRQADDNSLQTQEPVPEVAQALPLIDALYAKKKQPQAPDIKPKQLFSRLEKVLGERQSWDAATLRALWPRLQAGMTRKARSAEHEASWLLLAGFVLRPGFGVQGDDGRMEQLWDLQRIGLNFPKEKRVLAHWYLLWRRVAGGLNRQRQERLWQQLWPGFQGQAEPLPELIYLLGSLERLTPEQKQQLIQQLRRGLSKTRPAQQPAYLWALGRLLSRTPLYAGWESCVHPREVAALFEQLAEVDWTQPQWQGLNALFASAARRTGQREIDIDEQLRQQLLDKMRASKAAEHQLQVVQEQLPLEERDRTIQFGEALPSGLVLLN